MGEHPLVSWILKSSMTMLQYLLGYECTVAEHKMLGTQSFFILLPAYTQTVMLLALTTPLRSVDLSRLDKLYMRS